MSSLFGSYILCALPDCGAWGAVEVRVDVRRVLFGTPYTLGALPALGLGVDWGLELASGAHFLTPFTHFVHFPRWVLGLTVAVRGRLFLYYMFGIFYLVSCRGEEFGYDKQKATEVIFK